VRIIVIGGGIVGLATAYRLSERMPGAEIALLEKESEVGRHQTGHNSGVLHCGLYYKPGSVKARMAVEGIRQMVAFCRENASRTKSAASWWWQPTRARSNACAVYRSAGPPTGSKACAGWGAKKCARSSRM
jgi:L-2-hydroxyglutarate oxidase LhgO